MKVPANKGWIYIGRNVFIHRYNKWMHTVSHQTWSYEDDYNKYSKRFYDIYIQMSKWLTYESVYLTCGVASSSLLCLQTSTWCERAHSIKSLSFIQQFNTSAAFIHINSTTRSCLLGVFYEDGAWNAWILLLFSFLVNSYICEFAYISKIQKYITSVVIQRKSICTCSSSYLLPSLWLCCTSHK